MHTSSDYQIANAFHKHGQMVHVYDDGVGPLFILRDSSRIIGVIRASSWEEAHEIAEDELFPEADEVSWEAIAKECNWPDPETLMDSPIFQEGYGLRPNGRNDRDQHGHGVYQRDLNGEALDKVTEATLRDRYGIRLEWERDPSGDDQVCNDCAMMIANGEAPEDASEEEGMALAKECVGWCLTGTEKSGEAGFSWRPCDCCGSNLGGDRLYALYMER